MRGLIAQVRQSLRVERGGLAEGPAGKTSARLSMLAGLEVLAAVLILLFMPWRPVAGVLTPSQRK